MGPKVRFSGFVFGVLPPDRPKSLISGFCIRGLPPGKPKSQISVFCIRGFAPWGAHKSDFRVLYSGVCPLGGPKSPMSGFCIRGLPPGCASWARNPKGPKSHLFGTKWVAIPPYGMPGTAFCTEFRSGSRQIGPTPQSQFFFVHHCGQTIDKQLTTHGKMLFFVIYFAPARNW